VTLISSGPFAGLKRNAYGLILMDPPWSFTTYTGQGAPQRTAEPHYPVMGLDDLKSLPVVDLAAKDCALVLWVIGSHLEKAFELGRALGFTYKTDLLTWVKVGKNDPRVRPISLGFWSRKQTEQALLFTRGSPSRLDAGVRQLIETNGHVIHAPKREHSRKPEEQYERLERLVAGPRVELFARQSRADWTTWGHERQKFDRPRPIPADLVDLIGMPGRSVLDLHDIL
jgi:N6-adenosine-specific RNA methylase IME4